MQAEFYTSLQNRVKNEATKYIHCNYQQVKLLHFDIEKKKTSLKGLTLGQ